LAVLITVILITEG